MADSHVAPPVRRRDDDDSPRGFKIRASCSPRSSDAEANRRRRRWTATHRRGSRASPPDPNHNVLCIRSGDAEDRPSRRALVSSGEEDGDHMRRHAGVSDDERSDSRRRKRSRSNVQKDDCRGTGKRDGDRDSHSRLRYSSEPVRSCRDYRHRCRKEGHDEYLNWDLLKKSIDGLVKKVNVANIKDILPELYAEKLVRGRRLFCESCIKSQMASPELTDVFAALVAAVNTKFPEIGRLLLVRVMLLVKGAYEQNNKPHLLAATKFIAHLVNQAVVHELLALELVTMFLQNPTDDSVEVAVVFVRECGAMLQLSPQRLYAIFERFRGILDGGEIDKHVQFLIEDLFSVREAQFKGFPAIRPELALVERKNQFTHEISLEDDLDPEINLNVFGAYPNFPEDEIAYENRKRSIWGSESSENENHESRGGAGLKSRLVSLCGLVLGVHPPLCERSILGSESSENAESFEKQMDKWTNFFNTSMMRLTIMSGVHFEQAGLMKLDLKPGQEMELCCMIIECCSQERTYLRYFGLLAQRYCMMRKAYQENFEKCFVQEYSRIHRFETSRLMVVAKFFAHLLETDTLPWHVLACIRLTDKGMTISHRIFVRILFQELSKRLGIRRLNERLNDPGLQGSLDSIFPKDHPKNTRFCISFFASIGLGSITENLREHLESLELQSDPGSSSDSGPESESTSDESDSTSDQSD